MANVFISYERSAGATAQIVIDLLRARGHTTWWDAEIPPHRDYGDVIAERLQAADAVLVLWSNGAAQSHWVRAEADHALEHGKLVQAALDAAPLPLPFNRIQFAKLAGWRGDASTAEWQKVLESIEQVARERAAAPTTVSEPRAVGAPVRSRAVARSRMWLLIAGAVVAAVALAFALARFRQAPPSPSVARFAVLPFDVLSADADSRFFADALADQIATTLSRNHIQVVSRDDAAALRGPDRDGAVARLGIAIVLDGTVRREGDTVTVHTHLDDPVRHAIVWSSEREGPADGLALLQEQVAKSVLNVLGCSARALRPVNGLTDPALLTRYLRACELFSRQSTAGEQMQMISEVRAVTEGAPDFAPGLADLAVYDAMFAGSAPERTDAMREEAAEAAQRALALDPKSPDAYVAQALILPTTQRAERERLLREGIRVDPSFANAHGFLANALATAGRWREAIDEMRLAGAADLVQGDWSNGISLMEARSGGPPAACIEAFGRDLNVAGFTVGAWSQLLTCRSLGRQWDESLAMLTAANAPSAGTPLGDAMVASVTAYKTGSIADREKARALNLASAKALPAFLHIAMANLAQLGFVDDAFAVAAGYDADVNDTTTLFDPFTASMRRDPRFMQIAARVGLVDFWRTSGKWPDFCSEPELPYDCRAEAERVRTLGGST